MGKETHVNREASAKDRIGALIISDGN